MEAQERLAEFEWAFGNDAQEKMEQIAIEVARQITAANEHSAEALKKQRITYHGAVSACMTKKSCLTVWKCICLKWHRTTLKMKVRLKSRLNSEEALLNLKLQHINPEALRMLKQHRHELAMQFKERNPKAYAHMLERRKEHIRRLTKTNPELAAKLRELYGENGEES